MSKVFTNEEDEELIDLVRDHTQLYVGNSRSYKDIEVKNNIWKLIAKKMKKSDTECKVRWKSIRDYYRRKRRGTGSATETPGLGAKFQNLKFLDGPNSSNRGSSSILKDSLDEALSHQQYETEKVDANSPETDTENPFQTIFFQHNQQQYYYLDHDITQDGERTRDDAGIKIEDDEEIIDSASENVDNSASSTSITELTQVTMTNDNISSRRKRSEFGDGPLLEDIKKARMEQNDPFLAEKRPSAVPREEDMATVMFFKSIAETVSKFPPIMKAKAKMKVMDIVAKLEIEALADEDSTSSVSTSGYTIVSQSILDADRKKM